MFDNLVRFTAIKKDVARFCARVLQATRFGDRFRQRNPPSSEGELCLRPSRAKGNKRLRLTIYINRIVWMRPNIVGVGFIKECPERYDFALAVALKDNPVIPCAASWSARARARLQDVLRVVLYRGAVRA